MLTRDSRYFKLLRTTRPVPPCVRMPNVQPVHGRNCICHACQPGALGRFPEDRVNVR